MFKSSHVKVDKNLLKFQTNSVKNNVNKKFF